jgi:hypothetical protein
MGPDTQAIEHPAEKAVPMQPNMRIAVGTLITAVICVFLTLAMWLVPATLSEGGDSGGSGWGIVVAMASIIPAGVAAICFLVSFVFFIVALSSRHPR